jgi:hypothetical protein
VGNRSEEQTLAVNGTFGVKCLPECNCSQKRKPAHTRRGHGGESPRLRGGSRAGWGSPERRLSEEYDNASRRSQPAADKQRRVSSSLVSCAYRLRSESTCHRMVTF